MTDTIKDIFEQNIILLEKIDRAIYYFRKQQNDTALGIIVDSISLIRHSIEAIISDREYFNLVEADSVLEMLSGILEAYKTGDYILLADLLELQLVRFIIGVQELIISKEEVNFNEEIYYENLNILTENGKGLDQIIIESINPQTLLKEGYRVEFTSSGVMTLAAKNGDTSFYFHTNGRISAEAFLLAKHWYRKDAKRYVIYGLAFGYHIYELLLLSEQSEITIYESDLSVILLAGAFARLKDIFGTGRVQLVYDPTFHELEDKLNNMPNDEVFCVHYPSYQNIRSELGIKLTQKYVSWSNIRK